MDKYQVGYTGFCAGAAYASTLYGHWLGVAGAVLGFVLWVVIPLAIRGARSPRP
jgi:hypothetical protein